ncbi:SDR family oxidoreductase [Rhizobium sp. TH2]|uniref:SDR family oxidoreductase n=1 Tax=Rhizobium sp. TH2 TaxID=2775403 RepID=UPI00215804A2|nr:SDR family oxidoreductase [Rhizobium sp. TH2]UVC10167.1 SDR family oxidoreductase [Rhizobium sp. TH2]
MTTTKTALVTGANRGIGHEIARQLAEAGHEVWLGSRDEKRGEEAAAKLRAKGHKVHVLPLDVTDDASVAKAAKSLAAQTGKLDVLVNNAGIAEGFTYTPDEEPIANVKQVYEVNVFGPIRVTQAFVPLLKAASGAQVVMISSELGSISALLDSGSEFHGVNALGYNSSKTALNAATISFAKALEPHGIKVNAVDPGFTATDMNGGQGYRSVAQAAEIPIALANNKMNGVTAAFLNHNGKLGW